MKQTLKLLISSLCSITFTYANTPTEVKLTPDELDAKSRANITLVDTISIKASYSYANTTRTDDKGGVTDVEEPETNGYGAALRVVFNNGYIPLFKPYLDIATLVYNDRVIYIPSVGLRHEFETQSRWIEPYASFGVGYATLDRKDSPVSGTEALEDKTSSANLTLETGVDFYITDSIALDLSLRYDTYNVVTTIGGYYQLTTIEDQSTLSVMAGLVYRFGNDDAHRDDDKDGVVNIKDYCLNTPNGSKVDAFGCSLDGDKDGVIDLYDECPNTIVGAPVDEKGCALDRDNDGVIALYDRCPDTLKGVPVTECGCPPHKFDFSLSYVFNEYKIESLLNAPTFHVVEFLSKHENYDVRITGYADNIGSTEANNRISKKRALKAKLFLIDKGIDAARISVLSRGKTESIVDNKTVENRRKNRRIYVEFFRTDKKVVK